MNDSNEIEMASWLTPFSLRGNEIFGAAYDQDLRICLKSLRESSNALYRHADKAYLSANDLTDVEHIEAPCLFLGHYFSMYGHFLLETLPMVSSIMSHTCRDWKFVFLPFFFDSGTDELIMEILDLLGLSEQKKNVFLYQGQKVVQGNFHILPRPIRINSFVKDTLPYRTVISELKRVASAVVLPMDYGDRIFLSRDYGRVDRQLANEVERLCVCRKFSLVRAERHSLLEQIAIVSRAKVIAGFGGSNLHAGIFADSGAMVIEFGDKRFPDCHNPNQIIVSRISGSKLKFIPYMMGDLEQRLDLFLSE